MAAAVEEAELVVDGVRVFHRRVPGEGTPTVYCHGNPTHSGDWMPFLERSPGPAIAIDLPGWGRSDKPRGFDYTMHGLSAFLDRCLSELGVAEHRLVVHDWGSLALIGAQKHPERVRKLVVIDAIPLLPGYRWHWVAQIWRRKPWGEIANATTTKRSLALTLRQARGDRSAMPPEFVEMVWRQWDRGTGGRSCSSTATLTRIGWPLPAAISASSPARPRPLGRPRPLPAGQVRPRLRQSLVERRGGDRRGRWPLAVDRPTRRRGSHSGIRRLRAASRVPPR